ncbi:uncharacterized protein FRV6_13102 [Fusarium oxysporum]|uniref:Uncharacterized protein n=1 Tax=Fusarium oxysporum TaxID=5507 RepID=A0A2H3TJY9_FUSOX|nr:uncharacterized protein FRV6_13102 [Fusarium oxysporum]
MPRVSYTEDEVAEAMLDVTDNGLSQNKSAQKREIPTVCDEMLHQYWLDLDLQHVNVYFGWLRLQAENI